MNKELVAKWEKYNLLKGIDEDYKYILSQVLENQRLANTGTSFDATFKRLSIPIVRRVYGSLSSLNKLISIQPITAPVGLIRYINNNKETIKQVDAATVKTRSVWSVEYVQDMAAGMRVSALDAETELAAILAQDLSAEIERKVLSGIMNGAALQKTLEFTNPKDIRIEILSFIQEIKRNFHRAKANWIVTSPEIAKRLFNSQNNPLGKLGLVPYGVWEDINIYVDSLAPMGRMLIGYRGEISFDAGYVYSPYVPLNLTAVQLDVETFSPRRFVLHQSAHQLVDPTYYACMKIVNLNED